MKILCIDYDNPYGKSPGGQSSETKRTIFPLARHHEVLILTYGKVPATQHLPVRYIGLKEGFGRQFEFMRQVRNYVRSHQDYDLIIEQFTSPIGPIGLPKLTTKPVIGIANFMFWEEMSNKYHLPFSKITNHLLSQYKHIICLSSTDLERIIGNNHKIKLFTILPQLSKLPSPKTAAGDSLLFIGRPDIHQKGLDLLGQILTRLNLPEAQIIITGGITKLKNYHGRTAIRYVGYLDDGQREAVYRQARLVLMPSRYESFGLVQLEAASYGTPTVAFNLPVFQSRRHVMALVPTFQIDEFARTIERLWTDEERYLRLSRECLTFAKQYVNSKETNPLAAMIEEVLIDHRSN